MSRHLLPLMTLIVTLSWSGIASAQTRSETTECEVCLRQRDFDQCIDDAKKIDGVRADLRACQRSLDAGAGGSSELRAMLLIEARARADAEARVTQLEKRPTWARVVVVVIGAVLVGYGAGRVHQAVK